MLGLLKISYDKSSSSISYAKIENSTEVSSSKLKIKSDTSGGSFCSIILTSKVVEATALLILSLAVTITSPEPNCCSLKFKYN